MVTGNMSGLELSKNLKQTDAFSHIPVILQTADPCITREDAVTAGAVGLLKKPYTAKALISAVTNLDSGRHQQKRGSHAFCSR